MHHDKIQHWHLIYVTTCEAESVGQSYTDWVHSYKTHCDKRCNWFEMDKSCQSTEKCLFELIWKLLPLLFSVPFLHPIVTTAQSTKCLSVTRKRVLETNIKMHLALRKWHGRCETTRACHARTCMCVELRSRYAERSSEWGGFFRNWTESSFIDLSVFPEWVYCHTGFNDWDCSKSVCNGW